MGVPSVTGHEGGRFACSHRVCPLTGRPSPAIPQLAALIHTLVWRREACNSPTSPRFRTSAPALPQAPSAPATCIRRGAGGRTSARRPHRAVHCRRSARRCCRRRRRRRRPVASCARAYMGQLASTEARLNEIHQQLLPAARQRMRALGPEAGAERAAGVPPAPGSKQALLEAALWYAGQLSKETKALTHRQSECRNQIQHPRAALSEPDLRQSFPCRTNHCPVNPSHAMALPTAAAAGIATPACGALSESACAVPRHAPARAHRCFRTPPLQLLWTSGSCLISHRCPSQRHHGKVSEPAAEPVVCA